jgi:hypothetical protein
MLDISKFPKPFLQLICYIAKERTGYKKQIDKIETYRDEYGREIPEERSYKVDWNPTDRGIFTDLCEQRGFVGEKKRQFKEFFEGVVKACEREIVDFPSENLTKKPGKIPENNLFQSPIHSGSKLERCSEEEGNELGPEKRSQRNPYGQKEKRNAESYVKHLDHYGPVWVIVNGRMAMFAENCSKGIEWAKGKLPRTEKFEVVQMDYFAQDDENVKRSMYLYGPSTTV